jgi:deoxyribose-phosphate aldolase
LNHQIITSFTPKTHKTLPSDATTESITASNTASNAKPSASSVKREEGPYSPGSKSAQPPFERSNSPTTPNYAAIYTELASLRSLCPAPTVLKLILETAALTPSQILAASTLAAAANFDFIKTSTGFAGRGASLEDVVLMTAAAEYLSTQQPKGGERRRRMQVKASGGVRSLEDALKMLEAGATRLGTSSGLWIMQESRRVLKEREMSSEEKAKASERPGGGVTRLFTDDSVEGY